MQNLNSNDQSEVSKFFFVDRGDSYKPNKHINHIAQKSSIEPGLGLEDNIEIQDEPMAEMLGTTDVSLLAEELLKTREDKFAAFEDPFDPDNAELLFIYAEDPFFWGREDNDTGIAVGAQYGDVAVPYAIKSSEAVVDLISPDAPDSPEFRADLEAVAALGGA